MDLWTTADRLSAWLDLHNGRALHEQTCRILKVAEEAGEAASAWIGVVGQNPRKGVSHTIADVEHELMDVIITAAVALFSVSSDPHRAVREALETIRERQESGGRPDQ